MLRTQRVQLQKRTATASKTTNSKKKRNGKENMSDPELMESIKTIVESQNLLRDENTLLKRDMVAQINGFRDTIKNVENAARNFTSAAPKKNDSDVWREKSQALQTKLEKAQDELELSNTERRDLLHKFLDLLGRARVVCRFRPVLNAIESSNQMKIQTNSNLNQLTCE